MLDNHMLYNHSFNAKASTLVLSSRVVVKKGTMLKTKKRRLLPETFLNGYVLVSFDSMFKIKVLFHF